MLDIIQEQRDFFNTNESKNTDFRIANLKKLKQLLKDNEDALYDAIYKDFGKSRFETYLSELILTYQEINTFIKHLKQWSRRESVPTNLANFPSRSYIIPEPLGSVLVIGAWNYPYYLSLVPAISALAAGNTVILKPSELPNESASVMAKIINENFPKSYFHVLEGGVEQTTELLKHKFDKIFFTGSSQVGKIIYKAAAEHLTPVTLELGGKSPTIVLADCNIKMTAKRIVWAKYLNAGQTCVAPDYILVEKSIENEFLSEVKKEITENYPMRNDISDNYLRIINDKNFDRLKSLLDTDKIFLGGETNAKNRFISPTVLKDVTFSDKVMEEEIFGPILPVISFTDLDVAIRQIKQMSKPLSFYVFTKNKKKINKLFKEVSFGGGAVNDAIMHLTNGELPFGGVGLSGMGNYHGEAGFKSFSHYKSVLHKSSWFEAPIKYTPYSKWKMKILKLLLE
ncbi:aldehyde dehydrogenase [Ulvibacter antarcticus]|uniref:Aldehyde dehydrogenase n=1 Tax=Ulvibacter antarcticus TaxID=442714 RepID=A0A3L9YKU4_9FLAO|nr:aldehyde dehydrogenase [Ulvibacter antarcticus]RMA58628.1 aldehyde dehydrogenase (NAD+) [Ulvibacter antarcticus]